ncbi:MAG TPA: GxxExxY protein [Tepidisphaeraceae bacterium]|nr:GxxExxY protein [Tepidisphaeraceae bacterium]
MDFYELQERRGEHADPEAERFASLILDAVFEVHNQLGPGHSERIYEESLCHELELRKIPYIRQAPVPVNYKGKNVGESFADLIVGGVVIVELKSVECLTDVHRCQVISYLAATGLRLGLLINFNVASLKQGIKRVVRDPK